jgi:hypothetical protein
MVMADPARSLNVFPAQSGLAHLLLGDLRQLLEEPPSRENRRWLLAILDRLLAGRVGLVMPTGLGVSRRWTQTEFDAPEPALTPELVSQLQRLRDRVAHGAVFHGVAHEVRAALQRALDRHHACAARVSE